MPCIFPLPVTLSHRLSDSLASYSSMASGILEFGPCELRVTRVFGIIHSQKFSQKEKN